MGDFRIAVKAFVVNDGKFLLLERAPDLPHDGGKWDIPGGRLEGKEDTAEGVKREVLEEAGIGVDVWLPVEAHSFTRDDGQHITMISFLCTLIDDQQIKLSDEHVGYKWVEISLDNDEIPKWYTPAVNNILKFNLLNRI